MMTAQRTAILIAMTATAIVGCQKQTPPPVATAPPVAAPPAEAPKQTTPAATPKPADAPLPTISLGGAKPTASGSTTVSPTAAAESASESRQAGITALQPLQTLLGKWRGITNKKVNDMSAIENPEWVWDLRTDKSRPALVMDSPTGTYFRKLRMTGTDQAEKFRLVATGADGKDRTFDGKLAEPVEQFQEGGTTVQTKFRLLFDETGDAKDRWEVAISQQNNDRYLVELSRIRPAGNQRIDTIGHQRDGTSLAKSDTDFGEKKCIISGGLGTTQVSYQGKTYWVCCSGCKAAFEEDPESWLRDAAKKAMK